VPYQSKQDTDIPIVPDRPRLKDYLAAMKPDTWGPTKSQLTTKIEENMYLPPSISNMSNNGSFYTDRAPSSALPYSNNLGQNFTSLPSFNPHQHYQVQSSMPFAPPPPSAPTVPYQPPIYNQSHSFDQNLTPFAQPQMIYNPPPPSVQSFPQQQYYPAQSFYQPPPHPQTIPNQNSGLQQPSIYQCQNFSDSNRSIHQSLPPLPAKFDPYRPQPVGAYDIPKVQQTTIPPPLSLINPQDVYRPGGLLGMNQTQIPSSSINNSYEQNQFVPYIPPSASVSTPFANLSIN
jgi:hypothetical protein